MQGRAQRCRKTTGSMFHVKIWKCASVERSFKWVQGIISESLWFVLHGTKAGYNLKRFLQKGNLFHWFGNADVGSEWYYPFPLWSTLTKSIMCALVLVTVLLQCLSGFHWGKSLLKKKNTFAKKNKKAVKFVIKIHQQKK